jgi:hypothetical protein
MVVNGKKGRFSGRRNKGENAEKTIFAAEHLQTAPYERVKRRAIPGVLAMARLIKAVFLPIYQNEVPP